MRARAVKTILLGLLLVLVIAGVTVVCLAYYGVYKPAIAFDASDVGRRFRVRVYVTSTLTDRRAGRLPVQRDVVGEAFYTVGSTLAGTRAAEEDAIRRAVGDLAVRLVSYVIDDL